MTTNAGEGRALRPKPRAPAAVCVQYLRISEATARCQLQGLVRPFSNGAIHVCARRKSDHFTVIVSV